MRENRASLRFTDVEDPFRLLSSPSEMEEGNTRDTLPPRRGRFPSLYDLVVISSKRKYGEQLRITKKNLRHNVTRKIVTGCPVKYVLVDYGLQQIDILSREVLCNLHQTLDSLELFVKSTFLKQGKSKITEFIPR